MNKPSLQLDLCFGDFNKLKVVGEVKWKKSINRSEIKKLEEKLWRFKDCSKLLVVPDENNLDYIPNGIDVGDTNKILREIKIRLSNTKPRGF